ncbi:MAG: hydrogenase expression/formation protein HypE [Spirochaetota bacterium]|nr:MAG: hydrogenase expression/formation protein HypE [Spirochaetota bacterium]
MKEDKTHDDGSRTRQSPENKVHENPVQKNYVLEDFVKENKVLMAHGGGGRAARSLIQELISPVFDNPELSRLEDAARIPGIPGNNPRVVMTTDSYVVTPRFFPGGDIGKLSVCGTVNDLVTTGARPAALSVGFILEEGFSLKELEKIIKSMKQTADSVPVALITGDTKVVERGRGDGIYITTAGVGILPEGVFLSPDNIEPGDAVLINGPIGNHEAAIISVRDKFSLGVEVVSDCTPLARLITKITEAVPEVRCARDPTRGGVASILIELVESSGYGITIDEDKLPVDEPVSNLCEVLGMDPLYMANEGKMVVIVPENQTKHCLEVMRSVPAGKRSTVIGSVTKDKPRLVVNTPYGSSRVVTMPKGEQLPRIC